MARTLRCSWCGDPVTDDVTKDDHSYGKPEQEVVVDDVPTLCLTCNSKAVSK
jgi:hypothetical protein